MERRMTGDVSSISLRDEQPDLIVARWACIRRPSRRGLDRLAIVKALLSALDGGAVESIRLAAVAAAQGTTFSTTCGTLSALVDEFDDLEAMFLERLAERVSANAAADSREIVRASRALHEKSAWARRAAIAAFGHVASSATRKRMRIARHDIANAIGTVRNAILLMEDEASDTARDHFRAIAKRNSHSSEALVRSHLSDRTAMTPALGWDELSLSASGAAAERPATPTPLVTNLSALETVLDAIRALHGMTDADDPLALSFALDSGRAGVARVFVSAPHDRVTNSEALAALRDLATAIGLQLDADAETNAISVVIPISVRDERRDLSGAGQGHYADTVRL
jgi:hypothetical protein